jgi:2-amino-4-hydroxy-6-hydroxymethyldihydropteridine diphosphokinase
MAKIYLLLGGNMGDRIAYLKKAGKKIAELIGDIACTSSVYETQPWGFSHETPFLNWLIVAETALEPAEAMRTILDIEQQLGRVREGVELCARTIDIDILFYDERIIIEKDLVIPHPRLHSRRFALEPLAEVERGLVHPVFKKTIDRLLNECTDHLNVQKLDISLFKDI